MNNPKKSPRFILIRHGAVDKPKGTLATNEAQLLPPIKTHPRIKNNFSQHFPQYQLKPWFSSNLIRAKSSARYLLNHDNFIAARNFDEMDFGDWKGLTWDEIKFRYPVEHQSFWRNPTNSAPPNGESFAEMVERVQKHLIQINHNFIEQLQNNSELPDELFIICHSGTIRAAIGLVKGLSLDQLISLPETDYWGWKILQLHSVS